MRKGLGKGLSALVEETANVVDVNSDKIEKLNNGVLFVDPNKVLPSRHQPRKEFDESFLEELAESIKKHGVIQPLIVSDLGDGSYELIAGERRLRASKIAELDSIPIVIREFEEKDKLAIALIENIQRADLNSIEVAEAYKEMMDRLNITQEEVAQAVGKSRTSVTNILRLLKLPDSVRMMIISNNISEGHGRALLALEDYSLIEEVARFVEGNDFSVRQTEDYVRELKNKMNEDKSITKNATPSKDYRMASLEDRFIKTLGLKTVISGNTQKGSVKLFYHTPEDLDIIIKLLNSQS